MDFGIGSFLRFGSIKPSFYNWHVVDAPSSRRAHARLVIGVSSLPLGMPIELEIIAELAKEDN